MVKTGIKTSVSLIVVNDHTQNGWIGFSTIVCRIKILLGIRIQSLMQQRRWTKKQGISFKL
jgi:hypothetical protein